MSDSRTNFITKTTLIAAFGGLLFGYDTSVISGAVGSIDHQLIKPLNLVGNWEGIVSGFVIASALVGCMIGSLLSGVVADFAGRKRGLIISSFLFIISALGSAWPEYGLIYPLHDPVAIVSSFILYRIICGVGVGLASTLAPMYISEIAPAAILGSLVIYYQITIVGGQAGVYFVNWFIASLGNHDWLMTTGWRIMLVSEIIPALIFYILLLPMVETPRWLMLKNREEEAIAVLYNIFSKEEAHNTQDEIKESLNQNKELGPLFQFGLAAVLVGVMVGAFQQLVGINAVMYYAPVMFTNMGFGERAALFQTIFVGIVTLVFVAIAMKLVDRVGRKPLLILGSLLQALCMLGLALTFIFKLNAFIAVFMVLAYCASFSISWGPLTWVLLSELFPTSIKGRAMSLAVFVEWTVNLIVSWSFKFMDGNDFLNVHFNHGFPFIIFGVMGILGTFFVIYCVPETKGHSLEAIQHLWMRRKNKHYPVSVDSVAP
ncbi:D-xylose-proton symporter [Commensalibacter sp. Nvir]|uniref:sugar porter family MFS transporter n=1 Tax=Commensalibacter sp. Nvir TaxID=3069817 RepID=UPI002D5BF3B9|nr:D-xylose-proton symporter [Commensalibacter sp. Nvir]